MDDAIRKAEVLIEALSYIRTFRDRLTVIKLGGSAMEDPDALRATLQDVVFMETVGMRPVLVHGGGKPIDRAMAAAGLQPRKVQGRRYTDDATLAIVVRVLLRRDQRRHRRADPRAGRPGRRPAHRLAPVPLRREAAAAGRRRPADRPGPRRPGHARGRRLIEDFCAAGVVPVIPSLALDDDGGWLNVNADTAAAAVAAHLQAEKLVFLTDTPGILLDRRDPDVAGRAASTPPAAAT